MDWVRRRQSLRRREQAVRDNVEEGTVTVGSPHQVNEVDELRRAIAKLDGEARELVHLFYEAGRSVDEIATILGAPAGTVKSRLFKVRESLRQIIERKSHE